MDERLDDEQYIENLLAKSYASTLSDDPLYRFAVVVRRSVSGRVAYELLKRYELGQSITKDYDFAKANSESGGIPVSLEKLSKDIWIPESYIKRVPKSRFYDAFEIFNQDELNAFIGEDSNMARNPIVQKVLYCKDEYGDRIGKKLNLFMDDSAWRAEAKVYSRMLLEHMKLHYTNPDVVAGLEKGNDMERFTESMKGIVKVVNMYLLEMK